MPREIPAARRTGPSALSAEPSTRSLVIPTRNAGARFRQVLERLQRQELGDPVELIVIDSESDDGTPELAARMGARVEHVTRASFNHGATRNQAIALTSGERIALLAQDALPSTDDYLASIFAALDDGRVDGAWARQVPRPDCDPILAERLRHWYGSRSEGSLSSLAPGDPEAARTRWSGMTPPERYAACAFDNVASCLRRSSWERHPFPAREFGEDVAWAREVLLAGGTIAYHPEACVEHSHRIRMSGEFRRIYADHRNLSELFELRSVCSWGAVLRGSRSQRKHYARVLSEAPLGTVSRAGWNLYAFPYSLAETAAQFLGARSLWKADSGGLRGALWGWVDRRLRN